MLNIHVRWKVKVVCIVPRTIDTLGPAQTVRHLNIMAATSSGNQDTLQSHKYLISMQKNLYKRKDVYLPLQNWNDNLARISLSLSKDYVDDIHRIFFKKLSDNINT